MAVSFATLFSVGYFTRVHWTRRFLQGTKNTRPCINGHPVHMKVGKCVCGPPPLTKMSLSMKTKGIVVEGNDIINTIRAITVTININSDI